MEVLALLVGCKFWCPPKLLRNWRFVGVSWGLLGISGDSWEIMGIPEGSWGFLEEGAIREYRPMCTSFIEDPCQLKKFLSLLLLLCSQGEENLFCFQYTSNAMLFQFTAALKRCKLEVTEGWLLLNSGNKITHFLQTLTVWMHKLEKTLTQWSLKSSLSSFPLIQDGHISQIFG